MEISIEILKCQDCGQYALAIAGQRFTGPNCKQWMAIPDLCFRVQSEDIIRHLSDKSSEREHRCHVCGVLEGELHRSICSVGNGIYRR